MDQDLSKLKERNYLDEKATQEGVLTRRKGGRPKKKASQLYDAKITIYLTQEEKMRLEIQAENKGLALGSMIRNMLLKD